VQHHEYESLIQFALQHSPCIFFEQYGHSVSVVISISYPQLTTHSSIKNSNTP